MRIQLERKKKPMIISNLVGLDVSDKTKIMNWFNGFYLCYFFIYVIKIINGVNMIINGTP